LGILDYITTTLQLITPVYLQNRNTFTNEIRIYTTIDKESLILRMIVILIYLMERTSVVLKTLIVMSPLLFSAKINSLMTVNYVKPFSSKRASPCSDLQGPCLTLNEYRYIPVIQMHEYFVNNTRFYFYSGMYRLDYSLILTNLYNFSFLGRPNGGQVVTIAVDSSASITWNESWNIEISSIRFILYSNFTFIVRFEHSQFVRLSNISIYGNGHSGCSSIISEESALEFNDSTFIGINGFLGAAVMILASNITFRGSILFADNTAVSGGSIYLTHNSTLKLTGTSLFLNNICTSSQDVMKRKMQSCNNINTMREIKLDNGSGGAIVCNNSYLEVYFYSNFTDNIAEWHGGAMILNTCSLNIQGHASFIGNNADDLGGAMLLQRTNSSIDQWKPFLKNTRDKWGGALSIREGNFIIKGHALFDNNRASLGGGALYISSHANFKFYGCVYSGSRNTSFDTNALHLNEAKAFDAECSTDNALSFNNSITFLLNIGGYRGGSISCENATIMFIGTVYFNESYGSTIQGESCNMTFIGTTYTFLQKPCKLCWWCHIEL
jgi:predicted outer membrane repeat protein